MYPINQNSRSTLNFDNAIKQICLHDVNKSNKSILLVNIHVLLSTSILRSNKFAFATSSYNTRRLGARIHITDRLLGNSGKYLY